MSREFADIAAVVVTTKKLVLGRFNTMSTCLACIVMMTWCSLMHAEDATSQGKKAPQVSQRNDRDKKDDPDGVAITSEIIAARTAEIERLLARLHRVGPIEFPSNILNAAAVRALVKLQAIEAVPTLCDVVAFIES